MKRMNKKGAFVDFILYLVIIFILAISLLVIGYVVNTYNTAWQSSGIATGYASTIMSDYQSRFATTWDNWFLFLIIGYIMVTLILAFALRNHPVFAMLSVFGMIILGIVAVHFANAFFDVSTTEAFIGVRDSFPMMKYFLTYLPHLVIILGVVFIIILYSKSNQGVNL